MDYDPMLSKLIAYAPTRELAIARLLRALEEYVIGGIRTNLGLFRRILSDEDFRAARIDTGYLDRLLAQSPSGPDRANPRVQPTTQLPPSRAALFESSRSDAAAAVSQPRGQCVEVGGAQEGERDCAE